MIPATLRRAAAASALAAGLAIAAPAASACSCGCPKGDQGAAQRMIDAADYVFRGTVSNSPHETEENFSMKPTKILKGAAVPKITLRSPPSGGACGVGFRPGETRDVIAFKGRDGQLHVDICSQFCASEAGVFKGLGPAAR